MKWLWSVFFFLADTKYLSLINNNFRKFYKKIICRRYFRFIKKENPDVIISTHFLVNELTSYLKENGQIKTKLISIVTDFGVHNFWVAKNIDTYVAACKETEKILISKNIAKEKIRVLGIPIRGQFQRKLDKKSIKEKLGIAVVKPLSFTILILTGGIGMGPISQIVKLLSASVNVIVICGNNSKLYNQLKDADFKNVIVLGWIDNVEEVMAASDLAITKPGGSTISECLIMNLPMIFFSIIPGQELQNAQILSKYGLGFIIKRPRDIKEKVLYLRDNPQEIEAIKKKISAFRFENSSYNILGLINE